MIYDIAPSLNILIDAVLRLTDAAVAVAAILCVNLIVQLLSSTTKRY